MEKFLSENHTFEEYAAQVEYYSHLAKTITIEMIQTTKLGLFEIHCGDLIQALVRRTESSREKLLNRMTKEEQDLCIK